MVLFVGKTERFIPEHLESEVLAVRCYIKIGLYFYLLQNIVPEMTYNVSSGTLSPTIDTYTY